MILPDCVLLPGETLPLFIFEPRYRKMLHDVLEGSRSFCVARQRPNSLTEEPEAVACVGYVSYSTQQDDGTSKLQLEGTTRVALKRATLDEPYPCFELTPLHSKPVTREACQQDLDRMHALLRKRLELSIDAAMASLAYTPGKARELATTRRQLEDGAATLAADIENEPDPGRAADRAAATLLGDPDHRQAALAEVDVLKRIRLMNALLGTAG